MNGQYSLSNLNLGDGNFDYGILAMGGGSGAGRLTYVVPPLDAIKERARQDGTLVQYVLNNSVTTQSGNLYVARCLVIGNFGTDCELANPCIPHLRSASYS